MLEQAAHLVAGTADCLRGPPLVYRDDVGHRSRPPPDLCQYLIGSRYPPSRDDVEAQAARLVIGAAGYLRGPPPVCKDDDACGRTGPVVGQKKTDAEVARSPSPRLNAEPPRDVFLDCASLV